MLFNSIEYVIFIVTLILIISVLKNGKHQVLLLLIASYVFYFVDSGILILLLLFSTLFNFFIGKKIQETGQDSHKRYILIFGIIVNLGILGFFKYANFTIDTTNSILAHIGITNSLPFLNIILPVGISFYTFESISYIIDVFRKKMPAEESILNYGFFISFFPHLVAGPIVRASDFLPQLRNKIVLHYENLKIGLTFIAWGIVKKAVFADNIAPLVNLVYSDPTGYSSIPIILATLAFGIQIYCDFSGYTDIAIGSARLFGLVLPINFNKPYFARNPADFWRRWHISLTSWFQDYVFTPLYLKFSKVKLFSKLQLQTKHMMAFSLSIFFGLPLLGLWHGAAWNFVIFGVYHCFLTLYFHFTRNRWNKIWASSIFKLPFMQLRVRPIIAILLTQYFVFLSWIFFRVKKHELFWPLIKKYLFLDIVIDHNILSFIWQQKIPLFFIIAFIILHIISYLKKDSLEYIQTLKMRYWFVFIVLVVLVLFALSPSLSTEFIYFQF